MNKEPIHQVLLCHFDKTAGAKWFAVGVAIGTLACRWGTSSIPAQALTITSGFGLLLVGFPLVAAGLSVTAFLVKRPIGHLAHRCFQQIIRWGQPKLLRAASVLCGVAAIAGICWIATGSNNALGAALYSLILGGTLLWCWGGLTIIANELSIQSA